MVKLLIPDAITQELRNLIAVVCRELVFTKKFHGATTTSQIDLMEKAFHGSAGYASVLDEVLEGKGDYNSLFNELGMENNREGNSLRTNGKMLELKELFHRRTSERFIVHERDFVREVLANYRDAPLKGRNICDRACDVAANYKHALRFYNEFKVNNDTPSGMKMEDMADFVLRKMFVFCKGKKQYGGAGTKDSFDKGEDDKPSNWFFTGYFTFLLFGPNPVSGKTLTTLTEDGRNVKKKGRKAAREEARTVKDKERIAGDGGDSTFQRGENMDERVVVANMAATSAYQFQLKHCRDMLVIFNQEYSLLIKELTEVNSMSRQFLGDDDMEQETSEWRLDVRGRLKELKEKKRTIQEEEEQLRKKCKLEAHHPIFTKPKPVPLPAATKAVTIDVDTAKIVDDTSTLTETSPVNVQPRTVEQRSAALEKIVNGNLSMSPGVDDDDRAAEEADDLAQEEALRMASVNGILCTLQGV